MLWVRQFPGQAQEPVESRYLQFLWHYYYHYYYYYYYY